MKGRAFSIMCDNHIRDFSAEELHRVFKHSKEKLLYTAIVRNAVKEEGLTITSLYAHARDSGRER